MLSYETALTAILIIPVAYTWKILFLTYGSLQKQYNEEELFYKRHNCVVMHSTGSMKGWPPKNFIKITTSNLNSIVEPYLYFIETAKRNLDIAVMKFGINSFFDAVYKTANRGVKIRIIVNFLSVKYELESFKKLIKAGVNVIFYIDKTEKLNNIMHCKYMIKDYNNESGYLCMGSLNFTSVDTMVNNYEDVTFTSNYCAVEKFRQNFENCFEIINRSNNELYNKTILSDHELL